MYKPTGYSEKIFKDRYAFTIDETWEQACRRVARQMAVAELPEKQALYENRFFSILSENKFAPGGRIWYNSGRINPQLLNCFVLDPLKDSKQGWGNTAKNMIITSMTGGGCGDDFSDVRPKGALINGQLGTAPGAIELMRLVNGCAGPIRAGAQRRVALMHSLDITHPDIEEFLNVKLKNDELTYANISVRCKKTTEFIKAIKNDSDWELSWKGKYKRNVKARSLWETIVKNAYNSAEPGFLNWELALSESNIYYIEDLVTTNPCGEQPLSQYDCCDLGHLVLSRFIENESLNWHELASTIRLSVRFLDNVLSVNSFPMKEMEEKSHKLRRIGLGTTALADVLAILGYKYGSTDANKFVDKLYRFISKVAYEASIMLAIEKGMFPACLPEKHIDSGFIKRLPNKIKELILEHGIRNCTILTVAPVGTVSILSGNCSSGIEPMFASAYERRYWEKDIRKTELVFHPLFATFMENNKSVEHFVSAHELSVRDHLEVQTIIQKHIDSAVSKTINIPHNYPIEDMERLWLEYLPYLKGTTFYRENTRGYVDKNGDVQEPPLKAIPLQEAKLRFNSKDKQEAMVIDSCTNGVCDI